MTTPYTHSEVRQLFIRRIRDIANHWADESRTETAKDKCEGVAFSILVLLDGCSPGFPAVNLSLDPHPDDMNDAIASGERWFESGMVFSDCMLHEEFCRTEDQPDAVDRP